MDNRKLSFSFPLQTSIHRHTRQLRKKLLIIEGLTFIMLLLALFSLHHAAYKQDPWIRLVYFSNDEGNSLKKASAGLLLSPSINKTAQNINVSMNLTSRGNLTSSLLSWTGQRDLLASNNASLAEKSKKQYRPTNVSIEAEFSLNHLNLSITSMINESYVVFFRNISQSPSLATIIKTKALQSAVNNMQGVTLSMSNLISASLYLIFLAQLVLLIHLVRLFVKLISAEETPLTSSLLRPSKRQYPSKVPLALVGALSIISFILIFISLAFWYYRYLPNTSNLFYRLVHGVAGFNLDDVESHTKLYLALGYFYVLYGLIACFISALLSISFITVKTTNEVDSKSPVSYCSHTN